MRNILALLFGASIGAAVTWKILDTKYRNLAEQEIESVREVYMSRLQKQNDTTKNEKTTNMVTDVITSNDDIGENVNITNYNKILEAQKYGESTDDLYSVEISNEESPVPTFPISPDEFGTVTNFGTKTLTLYADDILTDEIDNIFEEREVLFGDKFLEYFDEYEIDACHIRDINNEMDYEILKSDKSYSDLCVKE